MRVVTDHSFSDDSDINREIRALFTRTNVLCRRFKRCSLVVKVRRFRTYCVCFYDAALWTDFTIGVFNIDYLHATLNILSVFGYPKYSSVTNMLELGLPSFNTLIHNCKVRFE